MRRASNGDWGLVARKELADLLGRLGRKPLTRTLGVVVVFGLLIPLRFRGAANLPAFFATFMAFLPARLVAIDSFAGERERGTLEALLALPLTDKGLAIGKTAAATLYGAARGWLFVLVWVPAALIAAAFGALPQSAVPSPLVIAVTLVASLVIAFAAATFGVWQSAAAPSVRAIVESGGILRLVIIVTVFFIAPWLFGLLSPTGVAPTIALPAGGRTLSLAGVVNLLADNVAIAATGAGVLAAALVVAGVLLVRDLLRRCSREALAMVSTSS